MCVCILCVYVHMCYLVSALNCLLDIELGDNGDHWKNWRFIKVPPTRIYDDLCIHCVRICDPILLYC